MDNKISVLLNEYAVSHEQINHVSSMIWQSTSIVIAANGLALGYFFQRQTNYTINHLLQVLFLGIIFISILWYWKRWIERERALQQIMYKRTHEIERELGMWKNLCVNIVDGLVNETIDNRDLDILPKEKRPNYYDFR